MHGDCLNPDTRKKLEEIVRQKEARSGYPNVDPPTLRHFSDRIRDAIAPTPPTTDRERLLAVLPKHTEPHKTLSECGVTFGGGWPWNTLESLINAGEVHISFSLNRDTDGHPTYRLAPPVEGVDIAELHTAAAGSSAAGAKAIEDAIAALRRRSPALDVSEVERVRDCLLLVPADGVIRKGGANSLASLLTRWLASRPKLEPVNAELLEACNEWARWMKLMVPVSPVPEHRKLLDSIARADAASKPSDSCCKPGENLQQAAARPATEQFVRELVARAVELFDSDHDTPYVRASILAGDCDPPKPGKARGGGT